jgi:hypothetical protein
MALVSNQLLSKGKEDATLYSLASLEVHSGLSRMGSEKVFKMKCI